MFTVSGFAFFCRVALPGIIFCPDGRKISFLPFYFKMKFRGRSKGITNLALVSAALSRLAAPLSVGIRCRIAIGAQK